MVGDEIKQARGLISPGVPAEALRRAWAERLEAAHAPEERPFVTDGRNFAITYRTTWPKEGVHHAFSVIVQQVSNLEAARSGRSEVEQKIEWSE